MSNNNVFQDILDRVTADPTLSIARLCKEEGVTYQSFNSWKRRLNPDVVHVPVSLSELADAYHGGKKSLALPMDDVLKRLGQNDKKQFAMQLGLALLDRKDVSR